LLTLNAPSLQTQVTHSTNSLLPENCPITTALYPLKNPPFVAFNTLYVAFSIPLSYSAYTKTYAAQHPTMPLSSFESTNQVKAYSYNVSI
jgi:hypothetical protein